MYAKVESLLINSGTRLKNIVIIDDQSIDPIRSIKSYL